MFVILDERIFILRTLYTLSKNLNDLFDDKNIAIYVTGR
jgi:hypothetical protein